ncbi:hypothetical protein CEXT_127201 [Caerostris extrusa]|uniref:Uncharacterized protein n=1 Tax=Caerostris extrusa TaxID=172846 RepID=A0AAV4M267_CAEEX|nr:hypothetical protein CEXT_127201 [Caerostris extrusa]
MRQTIKGKKNTETIETNLKEKQSAPKIRSRTVCHPVSHPHTTTPSRHCCIIIPNDNRTLHGRPDVSIVRTHCSQPSLKRILQQLFLWLEHVQIRCCSFGRVLKKEKTMFCAVISE